MNRYENLVASWAENDARWILERGEGRLKWQRIRFRTIMGWKIPLSEMAYLRQLYKKRVLKSAPIIVKTAPKESSIAVSAQGGDNMGLSLASRGHINGSLVTLEYNYFDGKNIQTKTAYVDIRDALTIIREEDYGNAFSLASAVARASRLLKSSSLSDDIFFRHDALCFVADSCKSYHQMLMTARAWGAVGC